MLIKISNHLNEFKVFSLCNQMLLNNYSKNKR